MRGTHRFARALSTLALAGLLGACASPIGVRPANPREVERYLTRSALTADRPSDFSLNELRRYDLLQAYRDDPDAALATLRALALADGLPNQALFALAELWFLRASKTGQQSGYAASALYAWALLFPEEGRPPPDPLDPRTRIAADLYNRALTTAFRRTPQGTLALDGSGVIELPFGRMVIALPASTELDGSTLYDFRPVAELEVRGLRNRYRRPGIGAPLAAKSRPLPGVEPVIPVGAAVSVPLTAVVVFDSPLAGLRSGNVRGRLELLASLEVENIEIAGRPVKLEAEPTAALAMSLAEAQYWKREIDTFLGAALGLHGESRLIALRPYRKGRIPAVFVHGTASSPGRWADMVNDLIADSRLRDRYAFWFFAYDSGNPIPYSGMQLRDALTQAARRAAPGGNDPCVDDMIVLGHSQGGLLTKLTSIDSGDAFWANVSDAPFDAVALPPADKELLRKALFVKPLPFVTEVIFLATPQRGSYLAGPQLVRRLASYFVRLPSSLLSVGASLARLAPAGGSGLQLAQIPTSIDNMSPGNPFIKSLAGIPVSPNVIAHSIIAVDSDAPLDQAGDGVVKYRSAHVDGVASELVVHSPHSGMQAAPQTVEEVRRIFLEHSARSACPIPTR